jgi:quercetin dioxygenase-like cupin family protein
MTPFFSAILFSFLLANFAAAQSRDPVALIPAEFGWVRPPNNPALQAAWISGSEEKPGPYILRVRLASGGRIPPHTHPDERNSTVLAGTISVSFGRIFDESKMIAMPTGSVYVIPAKVPHYIWARETDAVYQEAGVGPTGTFFVGQ